MGEVTAVLVPLINTNEADAVLASLAVKEGQQVKKGDLLAVLETTKATADLTAERAGYVLGLQFHEGETLRAGQTLCYLADSAEAVIPKMERTAAPEKADPLLQNLRITKPALELAKRLGVDLNSLPQGILITEKVVEQYTVANQELDPQAVVIYGGGGHAKSLIELIAAAGKYHVVGILDDHLPAGSTILGVAVLGSGSLLPSLKTRGIGKVVNAVGGIGDIAPRLRIYNDIRTVGLEVPNVVHPRAWIESSATIKGGAQVFFNAYLGSDLRVGFGCIINTGAIVSHDCVLGDFVNLSPGAILAGAVTVGERSLIGMGATVNLGVTIGSGARIGNSAVIKADVPENGLVRAGAIWPERG